MSSQSKITYTEDKIEKTVSISTQRGEEVEQLKFYSEENEVSIVSSVLEKYGDEPTYLNIRLDEGQFRQFLDQLHRLVQGKQTLHS